MTDQDTTFGPNAWLVDEMYDQYRADPSSVSESWRDFFADDSAQAATEPAPPEAPKAEKPASTADKAAPKKAEPKKAEPKKAEKKTEPSEDGDHGEPIRGAAALIVK